MSRWLARLDAKSPECVISPPAKTDKTPPGPAFPRLLSVLAVPLDGQTRKSAEALNDEVHGVQRHSGNPLMTLQQGDRCHAPEWTEAETFTFTTRAMKFIRMGLRHDADNLAELLVLRDRDGDDRRLCLECSWLGDSGRCIAAANGWLADADRKLEPVTTKLQRCPAFGLRKGLT